MFSLIRNIVIILLLLSLVYAVLSFTARIKHRQLLEAEYEMLPEYDKMAESEDDYASRGMKAYTRSYRPKLFLGVFIIPSLIGFGLIWLAQYG